MQPNDWEKRKEGNFDLRELEVEYTVMSITDMTELRQEERLIVSEEE